MAQAPYVGYEDYSPQGRAAIGAFNQAGGQNNLDPQGPVQSAVLQDAVAKARQAAIAQILLQRLMGQQGPGQIAPQLQYPQK